MLVLKTLFGFVPTQQSYNLYIDIPDGPELHLLFVHLIIFGNGAIEPDC